MKYSCRHCGNIFTQRCSLILHQKNAAYCLAIRGIEEEINCDWCNNEYKNPRSLQHHLKTCNIKILVDTKVDEQLEILRQEKDAELESLCQEKDTEIVKLKKVIATLKRSLKEEQIKLGLIEQKADIYTKEYIAVRDKPTRVTNNNNTVNNKLKSINIGTIEAFTMPVFKKHLEEEYTYELFLEGMKGLKEFLLGIMIKGNERNYAGTGGRTRPVFHRLENTRQWVEDKGTKFLVTAFGEMVPLIQTYWTHMVQELRDAELGGDEVEIKKFEDIKECAKPVAFGITSTGAKKDEFLSETLKQIKYEIAVD